MFRPVEQLRIQAFPPFPLAVSQGEMAIVGHTRQRAAPVGTVRGLKPPPVARLVNGNSELQAAVARCFGPGSDHIAMRSNICCVPGMVPRIPGIEAVVMVRERNEQFRACAAVEIHQLVGLPIQKRPLGAKVLIAELRWMSVMLQMVAILPLVIDIHVARIPIAVLGDALRTPVIPDAELGILVPFGALVLTKRLPCALERALPGKPRNWRRHWHSVPCRHRAVELRRPPEIVG